MSWGFLLTEYWGLVEADLLQFYGIDVENRKLLRSRSWRWFKNKILGLLDLPPSVQFVGFDTNPLVVPQSRLGYQLAPPTEG